MTYMVSRQMPRVLSGARIGLTDTNCSVYASFFVRLTAGAGVRLNRLAHSQKGGKWNRNRSRHFSRLVIS
jgi:hypothetical protein